jgi:uncharacterized delta-60 repeat protein
MKLLHGAVFGAMASLCLMPACGDNGSNPGDDDDTAEPDASTPDEPDAMPEDPDAEPPNPEDPVPQMAPLSTEGTDQVFGVAYDAQGRFYATGFRAPGVAPTDDRAFVVARFSATGALDTTFGDDGIASVNVAVGGTNGEGARGILVQSDGKVVIGGAIEHDIAATGTAASDRDLALVRFTGDGGLDTTFGENGIAKLDLNTGVEITGPNGPAWAGADALWNIARFSDDAILIHGAQRATGEGRTDTDWVMVKLDADGHVITTWGTDGKHLFDLQQVNASARSATILADGSIIGAGYANTPGIGSTQPVVYKVTADGDLDTTFGTGGAFHDVVLGAAAEAYGVAVQGDKLVTIGYGRPAADADLDWVSIRLNADGTRDMTWGENGVFTMDLAGFNDNGRNVIALPDNRIMMIGTGRTTADTADAIVVVLDANGDPDTTFAANGRRTYDLGGVGDVFWGVAKSPDGASIGIAGYKGAGTAPTAVSNDDAAVLVLPSAP